MPALSCPSPRLLSLAFKILYHFASQSVVNQCGQAAPALLGNLLHMQDLSYPRPSDPDPGSSYIRSRSSSGSPSPHFFPAPPPPICPSHSVFSSLLLAPNWSFTHFLSPSGTSPYTVNGFMTSEDLVGPTEPSDLGVLAHSSKQFTQGSFLTEAPRALSARCERRELTPLFVLRRVR